MSARKIRILFLIWADAANVNAQSLNARDIALRLDAQRFDSTFFLSSAPDERLIRHPSIKLIRLPPRLASLVVAARMIWGDDDIIFYPPIDRIMTLYRSLKWLGKSKQIIATVEGTAQQILDAPLLVQQQILRVLREADARYAISPFIAETMRQEFGIEMSVVPIGVDTKLFSPCDRHNRQSPVRVLFVGSLQSRKQVHLLLDLALSIDKTSAEFHIVGDAIGSPDYRDDLLKRKTDERLDHVFFHGRQSPAQVKEWMHDSDIFILPSHLEGTPKVVMEAAATGLPCIVFDDYHTPSVVDSVTGFQVKTFDEMLERLRLLIENRELRLQMGNAAIQHIKQFDWDVIGKQWEREFLQIAHQR